LQNRNQIEKKITSSEKDNKPVVTVTKGRTSNVLTSIADEIEQKGEGKTVFIIGRYNYLEPPNLNEIVREHPRLAIRYMTAHSSKGLEADYVILIGLTSGKHGFPCQIADDPVLNLVLARGDLFPNAEERRLFYVSITRAKKHVYLVLDDDCRASTFISEIEQKGYEVNVVGESQKTLNCPLCRTGEVVLRRGEYGEFYSCSNYPYCDYRPKTCPECQRGFLCKNNSIYQCSDDNCSFKVRICPACKDGYLTLRNGKYGHFYGCSSFPKCDHIEHEAVQDLANDR
jgi:DNA helicase-4